MGMLGHRLVTKQTPEEGVLVQKVVNKLCMIIKFWFLLAMLNNSLFFCL